MKSWQLIGGLLLTWLVLMMYISTIPEESSRAQRQLRRARAELENLHSQVHTQNVGLYTLAAQLKQLQAMGNQAGLIWYLQDRLQELTGDLEKLSRKQLPDKEMPHHSNQASAHGRPALTLEKETSRRKVENTATELWYYINSKMEELTSALAAGQPLGSMIRVMQAELHGYQTVMVDDFNSLREADGDEDWRWKESQKLGNLVQRRLEFLQNPLDCSTTKMVLCDLEKVCGFGCQLHHVTYCLVVAYATQRTMVLHSQGWSYTDKGWDAVFMPLSDTCTRVSGRITQWGGTKAYQLGTARVIELPFVDDLTPRPDFLPLAIPQDIAARLNTFHGDAPVWWIGQIVRYLMRPNSQLHQELSSAAENMGFRKPIVGVHIRRTDKIELGEAAYHNLDEYMQKVDAHYTQLEHRQPVSQRRVYLATDDPSVLHEAKTRYSKYEFISDNPINQSATDKPDSSLRGIIKDIHFLSMSDFLVCTFSSQVCRVAYELMQTLHGDASSYVSSLDDVFYFGGQNAHNLRAVEPHTARHQEELTFQVGDLLGIAGNGWNGFSNGTHGQTSEFGFYPSYKVVNDIVSVNMPTYPEVKEDVEGGEGGEEVGVAVDDGRR